MLVCPCTCICSFYLYVHVYIAAKWTHWGSFSKCIPNCSLTATRSTPLGSQMRMRTCSTGFLQDCTNESESTTLQHVQMRLCTPSRRDLDTYCHVSTGTTRIGPIHTSTQRLPTKSGIPTLVVFLFIVFSLLILALFLAAFIV